MSKTDSAIKLVRLDCIKGKCPALELVYMIKRLFFNIIFTRDPTSALYKQYSIGIQRHNSILLN